MRYIFIGILMISFWSLGMAQIVRVEYFIDTDPGFGKAASVSYSPGSDITAPLNVPLHTVSNGFHALYLRALDVQGRWSHTYKRVFFNTYLPPNSQVLAAAEYFVDEDPGYGNGTPITVPDNQQDTTLSFKVDLTTMSPGFHVLFLRVLDMASRWSQTTQHAFYVRPDGEMANITALKYSFEGNGFISDTLTYQDFEPAPSVSLNFNADLSQLPSEGDYIMKIWAISSNGLMSLVSIKSFTFVETPPVTLTVTKADITCFGAGNGTPVLVTFSGNLAH